MKCSIPVPSQQHSQGRIPAQPCCSQVLVEKPPGLFPAELSELGLLCEGGRCPEEPGDAETGHGEAKICRNKIRRAVWKCGAETEPASGHAASRGTRRKTDLRSLEMPKDGSPPSKAFFISPSS